MFVCLCICIFVYLYICVFVYLCICIFVYLYICVFVYLYICVFVYLCICIFVYLYICIFVYLYICVFVYLCICIFVYLYISRKSVETSKFDTNLTRTTRTLQEHLRTSMAMTRLILLRMRNVSDVVQKIRQHFSSSLSFLRKSCHFWIMWKGTVEPNRSKMGIKYGPCASHVG